MRKGKGGVFPGRNEKGGEDPKRGGEGVTFVAAIRNRDEARPNKTAKRGGKKKGGKGGKDKSALYGMVKEGEPRRWWGQSDEKKRERGGGGCRDGFQTSSVAKKKKKNPGPFFLGKEPHKEKETPVEKIQFAREKGGGEGIDPVGGGPRRMGGRKKKGGRDGEFNCCLLAIGERKKKRGKIMGLFRICLGGGKKEGEGAVIPGGKKKKKRKAA